jgi:hypothetical protein
MCYIINIIVDNIIFISSLNNCLKIREAYCQKCSMYFSLHRAPSWLLLIVTSKCAAPETGHLLCRT